MRILHVVGRYAPVIGGTEWLVQRVSEELAAQFGDEVTVFTTNCNSPAGYHRQEPRPLATGWSELRGVRVRRFAVRTARTRLARWLQGPANRFRWPQRERLRALANGPHVPGLVEAIAGLPADVVAAASFPQLHMYDALAGGRHAGRPVVLIGGLHTDDQWAFGLPQIARAIHQADAYIAYTAHEADYVLARGARPGSVHVAGPGVDVAPFARVAREDARSRLGLSAQPVVGFVGRMDTHKGLDTLIQAMPSVWRAVPEAQLVLAGKRTPFSTLIEREVKRWPGPQQEKTHFVYGFAEDEKPMLFRALDVLAYPSGYESFGISFLEAWASGVPVVGCRQGAIPCVVNEGRDGLLVAYQQPEQLAEAIVLLLTNPAWARALGAAGHEKTVRHHGWPEAARRFRAVYASVADARRREPPSPHPDGEAP
jgi:glycosyltransferase involved in cell wall biosynthesis